jgi:hypothetical protein
MSREGCKLFKDAELLAEYWCSEWRIESRSTTLEVKRKSVERAAIFHRFASMPHARENNYA